MSYHAPSAPKLEKPEDPLINMGEMGRAFDAERSKRGLLSTFLSGRRGAPKQSGGQLSSSLGNSNI